MFWRVQITSSPGIWKPRDHCEIMFQNNLKGLVPSLQVHPMVLSDGPTCVTYWIDMWKLESFWNTTVSPQSGPPTSYKSGYNSMYRSYNSSYPLIGLPKPARLMEDILHHLAHIKPYEYWDVSTTSTGAGFLPWINSSTNPQFTSRFLETAHECGVSLGVLFQNVGEFPIEVFWLLVYKHGKSNIWKSDTLHINKCNILY